MVFLFTMEDVERELSSAQTRCGWNPGNFQRTLKSQGWLWRAYWGECGKAQVSVILEDISYTLQAKHG